MRKGQISFDLMLIMIVAIIFVGSIALVVSVIGDNARIDSIRSQERQIGNELASVLNSATVLTGGDSFSVSYDVSKIRTAQGDMDCIININSGAGTIILTADNPEISPVVVPFAINNTGLNYSTSLACGQQNFTVTNT